MKGNLAVAAIAACLASGCVSITPATYTVSPEIRQSLARVQGAKARVASMTAPAGFSAQCRAVGDLQFENGLTVPQFVQKAFNDEFRFAGIAGDEGATLKGTLTRVEFSSSAMLVKGVWELSLTLESSTGKSLAAEVRHDFDSGFNGLTACNNTSQALAQAVQALVRKVVTDPKFPEMVK